MSKLNNKGSGTKPKSRDPHSKRSKKRAKRNFQGSRPVRRAADRHARRGYLAEHPESGQQRVKPGKVDHH